MLQPFKEVELEKDGEWSPRILFYTAVISGIKSVEQDLEIQFDWRLGFSCMNTYFAAYTLDIGSLFKEYHVQLLATQAPSTVY